MRHEGEIEQRSGDMLSSGARFAEFRWSCSCGFLGPWRQSRRSAHRDRDGHEDCMAEERKP